MYVPYRFHLENIHKPPSCPLTKLAICVANKQKLIDELDQPERSNGWVIQFLMALSPYSLRFVERRELSKLDKEEYPIVIFGMSGCDDSEISPKKTKPLPWLCSVGFMHDVHRCGPAWLAKQPIDVVLATYPQHVASNVHGKPWLFMPHVMPPALIPTAKRRTGGILLAGSCKYPTVYAERRRLKNAVESRPDLMKKYNVHVHPADGATRVINGTGRTYDKFCREMSRYDVVIFGRDSYGYLVRKYFEIPGAAIDGVPPMMVAPNIVDSGRVGLKAGVHFRNTASAKLIWSQIAWLHENPEEVKKIAKAGGQWFHDYRKHYHEEILPNNVSAMLKIARSKL